MKNITRILKKVFILSPVLTLIISIPLYALVIFVLTAEIDGILAYLSYIGSAYALVITITGLTKIIRGIRHWIENHPVKRRIESTSLGEHFMHDIAFRTKVLLCESLIINLIYILMKLITGIYCSMWLVSLAVYYILLAVMRFLLLRPVNRNLVGTDLRLELRYYRLCGIMLLVMNQALAGIVIFMVHQNKSFDYPGVLIYAMAAYSFYAVITAIVNIVKYRRYGSPVMLAARSVNLVAAMVSILSLETAMLARFGEDDERFRFVMTGATGGCVCTIVIGMAVFMIVKATRQLKSMN